MPAIRGSFADGQSDIANSTTGGKKQEAAMLAAAAHKLRLPSRSKAPGPDFMKLGKIPASVRARLNWWR